MTAKTQKPLTDKEKALAQIKAVYNDQEAEINKRVYKFHGTNHNTRRKIFAFLTGIQNELQAGNFSFLSSPEFVPIEKDINNIITFDGSLISKLPEHWEDYPEDYIKFISVALQVISYPFLKGSLSG